MPVELSPPLSRESRPADAPAPGGFVLTGRHVLLMLLAFFGVIGLVNAYFITVALKTLPGSEVKSPYEQSQKFNRGLEAIAAQDAKHWQVDVMTGGLKPGSPLTVQLHDAKGAPVRSLQVKVALQRPTNERLDHRLDLREIGDGVYVATVPDMPAGIWRVVIEASRDGQREFYSEGRVIAKD